MYQNLFTFVAQTITTMFMLKFLVLKKVGRIPEVMYSACELGLARKFYAREKQGLLLSGSKVEENASFSDKSEIPFEGNIYGGDIESLSFKGHDGSGLLALKVYNE